ncbi:ImmA/IrrE family metallo-endopeptidase [Blautia stercoris]
MTYEELKTKHKDLNIVEMDLSEVKGLKGLYFDGNIALERKMSQTEKSCVLAEELGHYYTTSGNILDQTDVSNRKQEYRARLYGFNLKIGLMGLIRAFEHGCRSASDIAEYLDVTEEYLKEAVDCYRSKYGVYTTVDNYVVYFTPTLGVLKID